MQSVLVFAVGKKKVAIQSGWNITILLLTFQFHGFIGLRKFCGKKNGALKKPHFTRLSGYYKFNGCTLPYQSCLWSGCLGDVNNVSGMCFKLSLIL